MMIDNLNQPETNLNNTVSSFNDDHIEDELTVIAETEAENISSEDAELTEEKVIDNTQIQNEDELTSTQSDSNFNDSPQTVANDDQNNIELENNSEELNEPTKVAEVVNWEEEINKLKKELQTQNEQNNALKSQYMRIGADFENFRRRTEKEKEELEQQIKKKTINELLPVVDNFERARTQIKPANEGEMNIHKSYQGVYKNLVDSLKKIGVSAMRPEGEPFDPIYHEAMLREPTNQYPEGVVIEQLVRGYLLNDEVLRHAMVKVSAPLEESTYSANENNEETSATPSSP
jgi:molecular chaperone GrpE